MIGWSAVGPRRRRVRIGSWARCGGWWLIPEGRQDQYPDTLKACDISEFEALLLCYSSFVRVIRDVPMTRTQILIVLSTAALAAAALGAANASDGDPPPTRDKSQPKVTVNPRDKLEYAWIPAGEYRMGCSGDDDLCEEIERPSHDVRLTEGFWIGRREVSGRSYKRYAKSTKRKMPPKPNATPFGELRKKKEGWSRAIAEAFDGGPGQKQDRPIVSVTHAEAAAYCAFAGGRLPTEAEWEYAARGGQADQRYPWGDELTHDHANYGNVAGRDQWRYTAPVGSFEPNGYGLYDMAGNVWEWCSDWVDGNYFLNTPPADPQGPEQGEAKVIRGGSWGFGPRYLRVSARAMADPSSRGDGVGFRCVVEKLP